jgi:two-component system sporulation sensor kinase B
MLFPIKLELGFIFDLRYIPFVLVALFGGYKWIFPVYIVLNIYRFFIGGEGVFQSLIFSTVILILVPLLHKKFINLSPQKRISCAVFVAFYTMLFYILALSSFFKELSREYWALTFYSMVTHIVGMLIIMILIEKMISNIKARESYFHSERLSVISELSASIAHEIRNPLTVTNGFLQLLIESKTLTLKEKTYIEFSLNELQRAEIIVSDFLAYSKPQSAHMVYSNFKDEIEYVENIIRPYAKSHQVYIQVHFTNTLMKRYDKNQLQQCLLNLFKNGIEAMKENGGILYIEVSEQNKNILIQIKDDGIGMTNEEISQLGKPYYSTKKEGTGLGMLMVYSTINSIKGKIVVKSKKRKGTTFLITIPVK